MRIITITVVCLGLIAGCGGHTGSSTVTRAPDEGTTVTSTGDGKLAKVVIKNFTVTESTEMTLQSSPARPCWRINR